VPTLSDSGSKARLLRHLDSCLAEINIEICPVVTNTTTTPSLKLETPKFELYSNPSKSIENLIDRVQTTNYSTSDSNPIDFSKNGRNKCTKTDFTKTFTKSTPTSPRITLQQDENNNRGKNCNNFTNMLAKVIGKERKLQDQDKMFPMSSAFLQTFAKVKNSDEQKLVHNLGNDISDLNTKDLNNDLASLATKLLAPKSLEKGDNSIGEISKVISKINYNNFATN
jgi:hypothetical protein